ncbi:protein adenylyltransferase SelO [Pontibacter cellulosilyticus]|uniref:Protein nucleotidyltransferase YdiU n=1 Tax=Pontibacter cellulosilyticus TaxID=1720253 RepID=A0A923SMA5_9BACT|nr:YdiU family protein [Pontibacter cellulosilyticus]MBC5991990.1 YdiU family protein [Pontibacter cellulosilyticus]
MESLSSKAYKKEFVTTFSGDDSGDLTPRQTPGALYSKAVPTPVDKVILLAWSDDLATKLGIQKPAEQQEVDILGGNHVTDTMYPYAACYAGHQFGNWAGQLGDGRAITLGEWETAPKQSWELQLKGAGPTPYSRRADGRAVIRSSVREYLMSEAMHNLGVPTTRALSLVTTGEPVLRDMFYNGNPAYEPGAIVMRVAPSFLRFGNFEVLAARKEIENLKQLVNWTIDRYYPHITGEDKVLKWFKEIVDRTAMLIVEWMRVGFVHGVMNTDNMSALGLTIDYGPYSFVDDYDPNFTPNTTDLPGRRYAFGKQPSIAYWNLGCLAGALAPLFPDTKQLVEVLETYKDVYWPNYYGMMGKKLGLDQVSGEDIKLIKELEETLTAIKPDMTIFFQLLIELPLDMTDASAVTQHFKQSLYNDLSETEQEKLYTFIQKYVTRIKANTCSREASQELMRRTSPRFILRNYLLHQAIEELEQGKDDLFTKLQQAMKEPYSDKYDEFFQTRPEWASQKAGCSMLSCSS